MKKTKKKACQKLIWPQVFTYSPPSWLDFFVMLPYCTFIDYCILLFFSSPVNETQNALALHPQTTQYLLCLYRTIFIIVSISNWVFTERYVIITEMRPRCILERDFFLPSNQCIIAKPCCVRNRCFILSSLIKEIYLRTRERERATREEEMKTKK